MGGGGGGSWEFLGIVVFLFERGGIVPTPPPPCLLLVGSARRAVSGGRGTRSLGLIGKKSGPGDEGQQAAQARRNIQKQAVSSV